MMSDYDDFLSWWCGMMLGNLYFVVSLGDCWLSLVEYDTLNLCLLGAEDTSMSMSMSTICVMRLFGGLYGMEAWDEGMDGRPAFYIGDIGD